MRKGIDVAAILICIGLALYLFFHSDNPPQAPVNSSAQNAAAAQREIPSGAATIAGPGSSTTAVSQSQTQPGSLAAKAGQLVADSDPSAPAQLRPETVLQNVLRAVRQYGEMFGGNPVGTNPEITSELSGNNPRHMNFITAEAGMRVNADGELIDAWGTPYFFHQISGSEMEIHSAGPDRIMWTADDLVVK